MADNNVRRRPVSHTDTHTRTHKQCLEKLYSGIYLQLHSSQVNFTRTDATNLQRTCALAHLFRIHMQTSRNVFSVTRQQSFDVSVIYAHI